MFVQVDVNHDSSRLGFSLCEPFAGHGNSEAVLVYVQNNLFAVRFFSLSHPYAALNCHTYQQMTSEHITFEKSKSL